MTTIGARALSIILFLLTVQIATAGEMLVNLGPDATRADDVEPYAAGIAADTQATRLGINSAGTVGQTNFDDQQVTITYTPERAGIKMVAFSDDGVTVTIRDVTSGTSGSGGFAGTPPPTGGASSSTTASTTGSVTTVLSNKGQGQALPNLDQSLKDIEFTFETQHTYEITVDYINTLYTGGGDVDGAQLIAYGPEPGTCIVDRIIVKDSNPEDRGPAVLRPGSGVSLKAIPGPAGMTFPAGEPKWKVAKKPTGSQLADPAGGTDVADISPDVLGEYTIKATCGTSSATFKITVEPAPTLDLDVDSNNNGEIAGSNIDSEDLYEASGPGLVLPIDKTATANLQTTHTTGTLTLSSSFPDDVLWLGTATRSWDLSAGETPPTTLDLSAARCLGSAPYAPLALGEPTRPGTLTLTHTSPEGIATSDSVALTLVRPVSRCPQNNRAVIIQTTGTLWSDPTFLGADILKEQGYVVTVYQSKALFGQFWEEDDDLELSFQNILEAGNQGVLILQTHGGEGYILIHWALTPDELLDFVGVETEAELPEGMFIRPRKETDSNGKVQDGFGLGFDTTWVAANWGGGGGSRSLVFLLACHSNSFFGAFNGAEVFGYDWCCTANDHENDMVKLLSRMSAGSLRPAGVAYDAGGFTSRMQNNIATPPVSRLLQFVRWEGGKYWSTTSPALFCVGNASGSGSTGTKVGYAGFHLDSQRDTGVGPELVLKKTGGTGAFATGPYNVQPSWGVGCEYRLTSGQTLQLHAVNTLVYGDGSTKKLILKTPLDWNLSN